ncbi:MAG: glycerophosphodiester phosphodiesterase [Rhodopirellula sp. TMED11]|nr:MAG: glycerophosphodiester phosphodiesterase [Rhodopirellula sp. TMED11]
MPLDALIPVVIAHRGASGYVPEHTLVAKGMAHAMGADFLEQDVVATKDHQPIVMHDVHLDTVSDVAQRFPDRKRSDGRFYAIDFTLAEIKQLSLHERRNLSSGKPVFPKRYAGTLANFQIPTLAEEIDFIQSLNQSSGRTAGIYPEIKAPAWHRQQGCDLSAIVLKTLSQFGYQRKQDLCYLQCFDEFEVRRIRDELKYQGLLIQLIGSGHDEVSGTDYNRLKSPAGLADLRDTADGIGPNLNDIVRWDSQGKVTLTELVEHAHDQRLAVHPWTVREDALPKHCPSLHALIQALATAKIDGVFADQPDKVNP